MEILAGLVLGMTGSLHCAGMCGPIALALSGQDKDKMKFIFKRILYNSGRLTTYLLLGAIFGLLGDRIKMSGLQQTVSILTGTIIIAGLFISHDPFSLMIKNRYLGRLYFRFKTLFGYYLGKNSGAAFFLTGILNGFLPCGLVYLALSGALLSGNLVSGILFMLLFGLGTFPLMMSVSLLGRRINFEILKVRKLIPVFTIILAILFILRGLNLGIPYISPKLSETVKANEGIICN
ncbi:MAG: hypothetical protein HGGPFJEG_02080 [Ignavibacteria bacterium]|nr:hypothetical protein [Ignavibacteria bacterium]